LLMNVRMLLDVLMKLPDAEGELIGMITSIMFIDYLKPFKANISVASDTAPMILNTPKETYPIGSPTVL
jgi:hypothetical protein